MFLTVALALLLALCASGEAATPGPVQAPRAPQGASTPAAPPGGAPTVPGVTPPAGAFIVQQLSPQAVAEVQHSMGVLHHLQQAVDHRRGALAGFVEWAAQYRSRVQQAAAACHARTYSAADNVSAGCGNRDTPASCEHKLLDWCMERDRRFKADRDQHVHMLKQAILSLQPLMQQADQIYPR